VRAWVVVLFLVVIGVDVRARANSFSWQTVNKRQRLYLSFYELYFFYEYGFSQETLCGVCGGCSGLPGLVGACWFCAPWVVAGGGPAAAHFFCSAKKSKQKKAAASSCPLRGFPFRENQNGKKNKLAALRQIFFLIRFGPL
jgi:hypothetical protein